MTEANHISMHSKEWFADPINKAWSDKHLAEIRPLTKKWHASEEGLAWHKAHARDSINSIPETLHICEFCGNEYMSKATGHNKFCSNSCKSAARRRSKVDDEDRTCIICGKTFRTNKYSTTKTCSRKCGGKRLSNTRREKKMKDNVTQTLLTV
jgi:predicted nucleic acid-binding Zn ribbon protein